MEPKGKLLKCKVCKRYQGCLDDELRRLCSNCFFSGSCEIHSINYKDFLDKYDKDSIPFTCFDCRTSEKLVSLIG